MFAQASDKPHQINKRLSKTPALHVLVEAYDRLFPAVLINDAARIHIVITAHGAGDEDVAMHLCDCACLALHEGLLE